MTDCMNSHLSSENMHLDLSMERSRSILFGNDCTGKNKFLHPTPMALGVRGEPATALNDKKHDRYAMNRQKRKWQ